MSTWSTNKFHLADQFNHAGINTLFPSRKDSHNIIYPVKERLSQNYRRCLQICALAPNFCSWLTRKSYKSYAGQPKFYSFRALDSLQISLEHCLVFRQKGQKPYPVQRHIPVFIPVTCHAPNPRKVGILKAFSFTTIRLHVVEFPMSQ